MTTPSPDGLREEIARVLQPCTYWAWTTTSVADAILALPGVQRLIAAEATVRRVEALADELQGMSLPTIANHIRRALDGES